MINEDLVKETCKPGTKDCCRYLMMGSGWECAKLTGLKYLLDARVAEGSIRAVGDNCPGVENIRDSTDGVYE